MAEYIIRTTNMPEHVREAISTWYDVSAEIVRCRDCVHFTPNKEFFVNLNEFTIIGATSDVCNFWANEECAVDPNGFCAWARRKEGAES